MEGNKERGSITSSLPIRHSGLEIATDTVANVTNIFSLAPKNSGLVAELATRFYKSKIKTNVSSYLALLSS